MSTNPPPVQNVVVSSTGVGSVKIAPPTFLERWGVVFVAFAGGWILLAGTGILIYFLLKQPPFPNLAGLSSDQANGVLSTYKQLNEQWHDSLTYIFDLLITKTTLP